MIYKRGWMQTLSRRELDAYSGEDEQPFWRNVNALFLNAPSLPFINSTVHFVST